MQPEHEQTSLQEAPPCIGRYYGQFTCHRPATRTFSSKSGNQPKRIVHCCDDATCYDTTIAFLNYPSKVIITGK